MELPAMAEPEQRAFLTPVDKQQPQHGSRMVKLTTLPGEITRANSGYSDLEMSDGIHVTRQFNVEGYQKEEGDMD